YSTAPAFLASDPSTGLLYVGYNSGSNAMVMKSDSLGSGIISLQLTTGQTISYNVTSDFIKNGYLYCATGYGLHKVDLATFTIATQVNIATMSGNPVFSVDRFYVPLNTNTIQEYDLNL